MVPKQYFLFVVLGCILQTCCARYEGNNANFRVQCGVSDIPIFEGNGDKESNLIVGGQVVRQGSWPFVAHLKVPLEKPTEEGLWTRVICGGTIINEEWILTAGHCVYNVSHIFPPTVIAVVGAHLIYKKEPDLVAKTADKIIIYPGYVDDPVKYDIALLHLKTPMDFTSPQFRAARPACLPSKGEELPPGTETYVLGWGKTDRYHNYSRPMRQVKVPVISYDRCAYLRNEKGRDLPDDKTFCLLHDGGVHNACQGDSGGPVLAYNGKFWTVVGVVSHGQDDCEELGAPSLNTKVSAFTDWIHYTISNYRG